MSDTDLELLARYTRDHAEDAFAEIVRRRLGLVFSAALRQVRSPQLAEEVAQSAFTDLARNAARLKPGTIVTAWLYQVTRRTAIDVVRRESRRQLREQIATDMNTTTDDDWAQIEPLLDEAMDALGDTDRSVVLLRYFENKSLREVGEKLGASEDAARKRVSRAVERLREFFVRRGVAVGADGLVLVISANAVQAAPAGLAATISAAAALAGTTIGAAATTTASVSKIVVMTTLQKSIIGAALAAAVGTGIYQAYRSAKSPAQNQTLGQQQAPLTRNSTASSSPTATLPTLTAAEVVLKQWQEGQQAEAVRRFVEIDWTARPLFGPASALSLNENQFQSLAEVERKAKTDEFMPQLDAFKKLARNVAIAGHEAAARQDVIYAGRCFESIAQSGQALDNQQSMRIVRLVGQAMVKMAQEERAKMSN